MGCKFKLENAYEQHGTFIHQVQGYNQSKFKLENAYEQHVTFIQLEVMLFSSVMPI